MDVSLLIQTYRHQRIFEDLPHVAALSLLIYDFVLTFRLEIELVWLSPWTYTKVLFLLVRYVAFFNLSVGIQVTSALDVSLATCKVMRPMLQWTIMFDIFFALIVLSIRTWAIWGTNRKIGIGLGTVTLGYFIFQCTAANESVHALTFFPAPFRGYRGCCLTNNTTSLWDVYAVLAVVEAVVLVFMAISAFRSRNRIRGSRSSSDLSNIIHRDGIIFNVVLLAISSAQLTVSAVGFGAFLIPVESALYSVLTCRVILNIRASNRGMLVEVHSVCSQGVSDLIFAEPLSLRVTRDHDWHDHPSADQKISRSPTDREAPMEITFRSSPLCTDEESLEASQDKDNIADNGDHV